MRFTQLLAKPGEHPLVLQGTLGVLESILTVPSTMHGNAVALLGHPHSLQGGTMHNKVVTTLARSFKELGIPALRFNFRGVGTSAGSYDAGLGESDDMLALATQWQTEFPTAKLLFAGFSFGSFVAYRAAAQSAHAALITVAPPVHHFEYTQFAKTPSPWLVIQGQDDEVVPATLVDAFVATCSPPPSLVHFAHTGHFFHGQLVALKSHVMAFIQQAVNLP